MPCRPHVSGVAHPESMLRHALDTSVVVEANRLPPGTHPAFRQSPPTAAQTHSSSYLFPHIFLLPTPFTVLLIVSRTTTLQVLLALESPFVQASASTPPRF